jgi:4-hydroxy-tetrahydrodipicolinate synthase
VHASGETKVSTHKEHGRFFGVVPAMATPFTADGALDEPRIVELVRWYIDEGVHGISIAGSQGEFFSMSDAERRRLIDLTVATVRGRVPIYAGTGGVTTRDAIAGTRAAESAGADLALVITPYFIQPTQDELVEHFTRIARATRLPVMLYNNPPRTQVNILPATLARCMQAAENIVGVKDSSGDVTQSIEYLLGAPRPALLFSGRDTVALALMVHGAAGTISPAANVFPRLMVRMLEHLERGEVQAAREISDVFAPCARRGRGARFPSLSRKRWRSSDAARDRREPRSSRCPSRCARS